MADSRAESPCTVTGAEAFAALLDGGLARAARAELFAHIDVCAACRERLLREAPELLLAVAAEPLPAPAPLALPPLPAHQPLYIRAHAWQVAAMLLFLVGGGALMLRRAAVSSGASSAAGISSPRPVITPAITEIAAAADQPAIESGADDYQIREYEAPGFDGKPAQWIRLTPAETNVPVTERS